MAWEFGGKASIRYGNGEGREAMMGETHKDKLEENIERVQSAVWPLGTSR